MWKFSKIPKGFWQDVDNQKKFFLWLGKKLNYQRYEDWYNLHHDDVKNNGGGSLLTLYDGSPIKAVVNIYPEFKWKIWKFKRVTNDLLTPSYNKKLIEDVGQALGILKLDDWYRVSRKQLIEQDVPSTVLKTGLYPILCSIYPDYPWQEEKFTYAQKKSTQFRLFLLLKSLLPHADVIEDYFYPDSAFHDSGRPMQFDIYVPSIKLALEYQGGHHSQDHILFGPLSSHRQRDTEKRAFCSKAGITLIEIPSTWEGDKNTIIKAINNTLPDMYQIPL
eukprot:TRINITY_DN12375_c0_g1_i1.p1 TRINITY_DN12375_c0_g1~~TRINITY_DN12375_c0_g1_i1.p1  ORF type:complete len:296 (+),score=41.07 TRINITY_DN12375_c0_g1_i1:62-889(+)